jgi:POT family proton-dependent oligopeptide transporter
MSTQVPNAVLDFEDATFTANSTAAPSYSEKKDYDDIPSNDVVVGAVPSDGGDIEDEGREPTEEELATLRKVSGAMGWPVIAMCLIEFAERASYYGCSGVFANFIRAPLVSLPSGSENRGGTGV